MPARSHFRRESPVPTPRKSTLEEAKPPAAATSKPPALPSRRATAHATVIMIMAMFNPNAVRIQAFMAAGPVVMLVGDRFVVPKTEHVQPR